MTLPDCRERLYAEGLTCIVADDTGRVFTSSDKGIKPMMQLLEMCENTGWKPKYQADRIIGKAALIIAAHCGIKEIYADVASEGAFSLSEEKHIKLTCRERVDKILNPEKTKEGPFESALAGIDTNDFESVMETIRVTLERLKNKAEK
ncbi:MAG: DUF1893 domain-containing protein [Oscillospiraceae bacterium]|nr:DUF1893 domain-containing protein [Oscillospiraceae bacterium]